MRKNILLLIILIFCFIAGYYAPHKNIDINSTGSTFNKIDTVIEKRKQFRDSIVYVKKEIIEYHKQKINQELFNFSKFSDSIRQEYLDSIIGVQSKPKTLRVSDSQAVKIITVFDSVKLLDTLHKIETRNSRNCDSTIIKIDTLVDTLKIDYSKDIKKAEEKGFRKGVTITSIVVIVSTFGLILLIN